MFHLFSDAQSLLNSAAWNYDQQMEKNKQFSNRLKKIFKSVMDKMDQG